MCMKGTAKHSMQTGRVGRLQGGSCHGAYMHMCTSETIGLHTDVTLGLDDEDRNAPRAMYHQCQVPTIVEHSTQYYVSLQATRAVVRLNCLARTLAMGGEPPRLFWCESLVYIKHISSYGIKVLITACFLRQ
jgi:hypothetical protein